VLLGALEASFVDINHDLSAPLILRRLKDSRGYFLYDFPQYVLWT
jgi:hypothetical protein